jgi:hypothetical protein
LLGKTFRLNNSVLGIYIDDTLHKIAVALPKGATVLVVETDLNGNRLVDVIWEGKTVMMFTIDLRNRCTLVESEPNIGDTNSLTAHQQSPVCGEKERLLRAYRCASSDYQRAVLVLTERLGVLPKKEYEQLRQFIDLSRGAIDGAHMALDQHVSKHGC